MMVTIGRIIGVYPDGVPVWTFCERAGCIGHGACPACWDAWANNYWLNERLSRSDWAEAVAVCRDGGGILEDIAHE